MDRGKSRLITMAESFRDRNNAVLKAAKKFILEQDLTEEEMLEYLELYPAWSGGGIEVKLGEYYKFEGELYEVITAHATQYEEDWKPNNAGSLFKRIVPEGVVEEWSERDGSNGYVKGTIVSFEGRIYESVWGGKNVYSPSEYPSYWKLIREE